VSPGSNPGSPAIQISSYCFLCRIQSLRIPKTRFCRLCTKLRHRAEAHSDCRARKSQGQSGMARRHEIQNLVRRGNVFYWRPRVPRQFSRIANSHLSLSLHHSCYMKAGYMVRRLNTLLHEMKMKPLAALTTKEQLEALFRTEAARMGDHLDNLQFAARRTGTDPLLALRADLEVGWSYRLIELFGTMRRLDF